MIKEKKSKVATEKVLNVQRGKIAVVNLRMASIYSEAGGSIPITNQVQTI